jgi:hypothetical protein
VWGGGVFSVQCSGFGVRGSAGRGVVRWDDPNLGGVFDRGVWGWEIANMCD